VCVCVRVFGLYANVSMFVRVSLWVISFFSRLCVCVCVLSVSLGAHSSGPGALQALLLRFAENGVVRGFFPDNEAQSLSRILQMSAHELLTARTAMDDSLKEYFCNEDLLETAMVRCVITEWCVVGHQVTVGFLECCSYFFDCRRHFCLFG
jgi:hypothetical protein